MISSGLRNYDVTKCREGKSAGTGMNKLLEEHKILGLRSNSKLSCIAME
jgi:hypothetical protein